MSKAYLQMLEAKATFFKEHDSKTFFASLQSFIKKTRHNNNTKQQCLRCSNDSLDVSVFHDSLAYHRNILFPVKTNIQEKYYYSKVQFSLEVDPLFTKGDAVSAHYAVKKHDVSFFLLLLHFPHLPHTEKNNLFLPLS